VTWLQDKTPDQIRASALQLAARKNRAGCTACADAYIDLARRNGATDDEISAALGETVLTSLRPVRTARQ
jgi:AhpD family alkylhydroperoxidase